MYNFLYSLGDGAGLTQFLACRFGLFLTFCVCAFLIPSVLFWPYGWLDSGPLFLILFGSVGSACVGWLDLMQLYRTPRLFLFDFSSFACARADNSF